MKKIFSIIKNIFIASVLFINSVYSKVIAVESVESIDQGVAMRPSFIAIIGKNLRNILGILIIPFIIISIIMYYRKKKYNKYKKITKILFIITVLIIALYYLLVITFPDYHIYF